MSIAERRRKQRQHVIIVRFTLMICRVRSVEFGYLWTERERERERSKSYNELVMRKREEQCERNSF